MWSDGLISTAKLRDELQAALGAAYTLGAELGGGGMSRVFVARDMRLEREVVIKVLAPELAAGLSAERFEREIRLAAAMQHPLIVPLLSAGSTPGGGVPYYSMPYVQGESLRARLSREPRPPLAESMRVLRDVSEALAYAHDRGVVHRDIKPENILLSGGHAVVADFGIARAIAAAGTEQAAPIGERGASALTATGMSLGTPAYMAPEQAVGDPRTDHRADLYAVGCVAYEMLAGHPVFEGRTPQELCVAHLVERPRPIEDLRADVPPEIAALVMRCLEKLPGNRPRNAAELVAVLDAAGVGHVTPASRATAHPARSPRAIRVAFVTALAACVPASLAVKFASDRMGLPDWTLPGAIAVMVAGLIAFAYAGTRHPHLSWRRAGAASAGAFGVFASVVTIYMVLRAFGIGPVGSLLAAGTLPERPLILVGDFDIGGADTALGPVLGDAVRADLGQSRAIAVMPLSAVGAGLQRMRRAPTTRLDHALARELAEREGANAVVDGSLVKLGAGYVVTLRLSASQSGDELVSYRATADGPGSLLATVGELTRNMRRKIGESLSEVRASPTLMRATTPSLDAFRKYAEGLRVNSTGSFTKAVGLFEQAVSIDPTFASAWMRLGTTLNNVSLQFDTRVEPDRQHEAISTAYRLRDRLPDNERLAVEAEYFTWIVPNFAKVMDTDNALIALDSLNPAVWNNAGMKYRMRGEHVASEPYFRRAAALGRDLPLFTSNVATTLLYLGRFAESDSARRDLEQRFPRSPMVPRLRLWADLARGPADSIPPAAVALPSPAELAWGERLLGRLRDAQQFEDASLADPAAGAPRSMAFDDSLAALELHLWLAGPTPGATAQIDTLLAHHAMRALPPRERPYFTLATGFARAGLPSRARALMAEYARDVTDTLVRREREWEERESLGEIALAEGRWHDAIDEFNASTHTLYDVENPCPNCVYEYLGRAYDAGGQRDSAIANYERYLTKPFAVRLVPDVWYRARVERRLGELYDAAGNWTRAAAHYQAFIALWRDADGELQPPVAEARRRLAAVKRRGG